MAQFTYTTDEQLHLEALREKAWLDVTGGFYDTDPAYWRHCASIAADQGDEETVADCIEIADALECGMTSSYSGETL
jgi:hypothetical protein